VCDCAGAEQSAVAREHLVNKKLIHSELWQCWER